MNERINKFDSMNIGFDFIPKPGENIKIIEDIKSFCKLIQEDKVNIQ